jgi:hypothetical protein
MELLDRLDTRHNNTNTTMSTSTDNDTNIRDMQNDRTTRPRRGWRHCRSFGSSASTPFIIPGRFDFWRYPSLP